MMAQPPATAPRVLLTVSGEIPADIRQLVESGRRPRVDYLQIADELGADLVDYSPPRVPARVTHRRSVRNLVLAWHCFRRRADYDVVVTDGEQVGLPFATLLWLARRRPIHLMVVHILSVPKKSWLFRMLGLRHRIDGMFVYAASQQQYIVDQLGVDREAVRLTSFMVDTRFFAPHGVDRAGGRFQICSAGLEFRDYATLLDAVDGLDVDVVIAAASPWSKRSNELADRPLPDNVRVVRLDLFELRRLYAESDLMVMPLHDSDFQAGVTSLLEAMAMGLPIVCSQTRGQTDVITHDVNGRYVPVADAPALRAAIVDLIADPNACARLGAAGRAWVEQVADIEHYARRLSDDVRSRAEGVRWQVAG